MTLQQRKVTRKKRIFVGKREPVETDVFLILCMLVQPEGVAFCTEFTQHRF